MKLIKVISLMSLLLLFGTVQADNNGSFNNGGTNAGASSSAGAGALAGSNINLDQSAHNSGNSVGSDLSNIVPQVSAPGLATTLTETCMGSTSAGASGAGFGFSFGTTWRDTACVRRLDARQLSAFGDIPTAREMMCDSDLVREAAQRAGRPCVADGGKPYGAVAEAPRDFQAPAQFQQEPTPEAASPVVNKQVHE